MNAQNWPSNSGWKKLADSSSSRHSFLARVTDLLPLPGAARPVCHGSPHSSQGSLLLLERQSPLTASPHPTPIKLSQLAGLETGAGRKKFERSREFRRDGASLRKLLFGFLSNWSADGSDEPTDVPRDSVATGERLSLLEKWRLLASVWAPQSCPGPGAPELGLGWNDFHCGLCAS